nr:hypothetical protein Iba_scaffold1446773CG0010 [Ipomoea batatas]
MITSLIPVQRRPVIMRTKIAAPGSTKMPKIVGRPKIAGSLSSPPKYMACKLLWCLIWHLLKFSNMTVFVTGYHPGERHMRNDMHSQQMDNDMQALHSKKQKEQLLFHL